MIIHVKQSFEIKNKYGEKFSARNGDITVPPEWVIHEDFFKTLCDCGKITAHVDTKSVELEQAKEEAVKQETKKNKK